MKLEDSFQSRFGLPPVMDHRDYPNGGVESIKVVVDHLLSPAESPIPLKIERTLLLKNETAPFIVALTSFPRSGNTTYSKYLEILTSMFVGNAIEKFFNKSTFMMELDYPRGRPMSDTPIYHHGMFFKSHQPGNHNCAAPWKFQKSLTIVRNPFDVFPSFFLL